MSTKLGRRYMLPMEQMTGSLSSTGVTTIKLQSSVKGGLWTIFSRMSHYTKYKWMEAHLNNILNAQEESKSLNLEHRLGHRQRRWGDDGRFAGKSLAELRKWFTASGPADHEIRVQSFSATICTPSKVYFMSSLNQINIDMNLCECQPLRNPYEAGSGHWLYWEV